MEYPSLLTQYRLRRFHQGMIQMMDRAVIQVAAEVAAERHSAQAYELMVEHFTNEIETAESLSQRFVNVLCKDTAAETEFIRAAHEVGNQRSSIAGISFIRALNEFRKEMFCVCFTLKSAA